MIVSEMPVHLRRAHDEETGLALIRLIETLAMTLGIIRRKIEITVAAFAFLLVIYSFSGSAQPSQPPPDELIRRVVRNELRAEDQDHSHWMFRLETEKKNAQKEVDEVVETKNGDLMLPILINGHELTAKQQQESDKRLEQLLHSPEALRKSLKDKNQDAARSQRLLRMLPDALIFNYGERRGDLVQLTFKPNPDFHPGSREAEVFHAMDGSLWVDSKQERVAEITGRLVKAVKFGGGLLGHLDKVYWRWRNARRVFAVFVAPRMVCQKGHFARTVALPADVIKVEVLQLKRPDYLLGMLGHRSPVPTTNALW